MKSTLFIAAIILFSFSLRAQDAVNDSNDEIKSLVGPETKIGFHLAADAFFNSYFSQPAVYNGGRIGFNFNHYLFMGAGGYGLSTPVILKNWVDGNDVQLEMGYAGLSLEPMILPKQVCHISFPLFAGIGSAMFHRPGNWNFQIDNDAFYILQSGAQVGLTVFKWLRVSGGINYTYTYKLNLQGVNNDLMNGLGGSLSLKLGKF